MKDVLVILCVFAMIAMGIYLDDRDRARRQHRRESRKRFLRSMGISCSDRDEHRD